MNHANLEVAITNLTEAINAITSLKPNYLTEGSKKELIECFEANIESLLSEGKEETNKELIVARMEVVMLWELIRTLDADVLWHEGIERLVENNPNKFKGLEDLIHNKVA